MKKVSIIVPTYKRANMLTRAIDSVLNQTYDNVEVLVVDDNNPDTEWRQCTTSIMEQYRENPKVRYICHPQNMNGSVARNTGIQEATGELISYLDDDDYYAMDKIERQVKYLEEHPHYRAVYCGWNRDNHDFVPEGEGDLSYDILSGTNIIITNSIMMWRSDCMKCGGWDPNLMRHQEAAYLLNYFRNGGLMGRIEDVLVYFDTSDRNNVSNPQKTEEQLLYLLESYKDVIDRCERNHPGAAKKIYASRTLGIILPYMKNHNYWQALLRLFKGFLQYPNEMRWIIRKYLSYRLSSKYTKQSR